MGEKLVEHGGGHPLLWQHLFWFFGHPEVYIVIVPAMGIAAEIIATFIRKPVFGYRVIVVCWLVITALSFLVWGHHMFISGINPFAGSVFAVLTLYDPRAFLFVLVTLAKVTLIAAIFVHLRLERVALVLIVLVPSSHRAHGPGRQESRVHAMGQRIVRIQFERPAELALRGGPVPSSASPMPCCSGHCRRLTRRKWSLCA